MEASDDTRAEELEREPESDVEEAQATNDELEHTEGGVTTRSDATDVGVPMQPGSPDEPQGPEDALGPGAKRGDYSDRIGPAGYDPHEVVPTDGDGGEPTRVDPETGERSDADDAVEVPASSPSAAAVAQRPRADDIGDEEGLKGGVETG